ncbi:MAG: hypothetical protein R2873_14455 [Caldilineaceae bacterium]
MSPPRWIVWRAKACRPRPGYGPCSKRKGAFYTYQNSVKMAYNPASGEYEPASSGAKTVHIADLKRVRGVVKENDGGRWWIWATACCSSNSTPK